MILQERAHTHQISHPPLPAWSLLETDVALLQAARAMDKYALVRIFDLYSPALYKFALRMCQNPVTADHIVGDVFAKLLEQLSSGRGPSRHLRAYLFQAAYHLVVDEARAAQRTVSLDVLVRQQDEKPVDQNLESRLAIEKSMNAIRTVLTRDQRHVIVLRFQEGMSVKETAAILGKREDYVKVIQNRAIKTLRKILFSWKPGVK